MIQKSKSAKAPKVQPPHKRGAVPGPLAASPSNKPVDAVLLVTQLEPSPTNPRKHFDDEALQELATTIRQHGILEPILVRRQADWVSGRGRDLYEIVAGERRYRAAKLAKLKEVPCRIATLTDAEVLEIQVVENLARSDLNAIEEAIGFKQLLDTGLTQEQLAEKIGKTQAHVSNRVRLLELPEEWQKLIVAGKLPPSHARELMAWTKVPKALEALAKHLKRAEELPSLAHWKSLIYGAVRGATAALSGYDNSSGTYAEWRLRPSKEQEKELGIVVVHDGWRHEKRAINTGLAAKLKRELLARRREKAEKEGNTVKSKGKPQKKELTEAELRSIAREEAQRTAAAVYEWRAKWLAAICERKLATQGLDRKHDATVLRLALYVAGSREFDDYDIDEVLKRLFKERDIVVKNHRSVPGQGWLGGEWDALHELPDEGLPKLLVEFLGSLVETMPPCRIEAIAEQFDVNMAEEWPRWKGHALIKEFYELHTIDQLQELGKQLNVLVLGGPKDYAVGVLCDGYQTSGEPIKLPKSILDAKAPKR